MTTTTFVAIPQDTVYFGETRSSPAGESHHGGSLFPPPISAWQGLIRTRLLADAGVNLRDRSPAQRRYIESLVGTPDSLPSGWKMTAPIPVRASDTGGFMEGWFPTPQYLHRAADAAGSVSPRPLRLSPLPESAHRGLLSDLGGTSPSTWPVPLAAQGAGRTEPFGGWLNSRDLLAVLSGHFPAILSVAEWRERRNAWHLPPFISEEIRPGLAIRRPTATARDGMLYFLKTLRFQSGSGLMGSLQADLPQPLRADALQRDLVQVGRKARPLLLGSAPPPEPAWESLVNGDYLPSVVEDGFRFWLYLASPVSLENSLQPRLPIQAGTTLEIQAALLQKPHWLGGFSLVDGRPRPNRPVVPPGSAWLIRVSGGSPASRASAIRALHHQTSLADAVRGPFGEGLTLVGLLEPLPGGHP